MALSLIKAAFKDRKDDGPTKVCHTGKTKGQETIRYSKSLI